MEIFFHIKLAIRSLLYNIKPAVLLCLSITTGLTSFILISGYVTWERGFDRVFPERENIYRIITGIYSSGELKMSKPQNERGLGVAMKENFPEVVEAGFLTGTINPQYKIGEEIFTDEMVYHASAGFLDVFSIDMVQGDRGHILRAPYTAVISESAAAKYFGDADPVGETIFKYPAFDYVIEGVFEDIPGQAHFSFDILLSFHDQMHLPPPVKDYWGETVFYTYLKLRPGIDVRLFEDNMNELVMAHKKEHFDRNNSLHKYHLQPLNDIHLNSEFEDDLQKAVRADYLYLLLIAGFLILIAAGFNYLHFSFSNLARRSSHIGIKKVNGAGSFMHGNQKEIAGVVDNFKFQMMNDPASPLFIQYAPENAVIAFVRLKGGSQGRGLESLEETFRIFSPGFILDYNFLDSEFNHRFDQLKSMGRIMTIAGYLAIIIACLGLLGLTVHSFV